MSAWICENPDCRTAFPEYVNGCPRCYDNGGLRFSVVARDPRVDPRAGDRLLLGKARVRVLQCEVDGQVFYESNRKPYQIGRQDWIDWCAAANAQVLPQGGTS
jgi:hypothetical protein